MTEMQFRELDPADLEGFQRWADAHETPEHWGKRALYHPAVRERWEATGAAVRLSTIDKLNPARFPEMSPKMGAIVAHICQRGAVTQPAILELVKTSDGHILARTSGDIGHNCYIGRAADLRRNWTALLDAAGLDENERTAAERMYALRVHG